MYGRPRLVGVRILVRARISYSKFKPTRCNESVLLDLKHEVCLVECFLSEDVRCEQCAELNAVQ